MKVRDIKQYREKVLVNRNDIDYDSFCLGKKDEPLLKDFYGSGKNIDNIVGQISKFAKNTQTQIFYEFLQNADDAKASKLAILFDKKWFLVVNNGEAFKTDGTEIPGQLRSFLNKEDSEKAFDEETIGKYGLGSKLLYDLLTNQDAEEKKNERLTDAIINNLKSPIIFSWSSLEQWNELKYWKADDNFDFIDCKQESAPLLTKLLYAYYPAYFQERKKLRNGEEKELFSTIDLTNLQTLFFGEDDHKGSFFNKHSEFSFDKGTAILIPLGEGVVNNLNDAIENQTLIERLATSLSFLKHTKKIFINDKTIVPIHKQEFKIDLQYEGKKKDKQGNNKAHTFDVQILLPSNISAINDNFCNFYQFLPISNETQGLGFIINAEELELIQNRQEIDWDDYSKSRIKIIGEKLIERLGEISENNKPLYFHFLKCFAKAKGNFLEEYLENPIKEFLSTKLPTSTNLLIDKKNIRVKGTGLNVLPDKLGLNIEWLNSDLNQIKDKFKLQIWTINDLLLHGDEVKIKNWVSSLSNSEYQLLLSEIDVNNDNVPFIKTSKDNVISQSELKNTENIIPLTSKTKDLKAIFDAQSIEYTDIALLDFEDLLPSFDILDRLKKKIESIKANLNENQKYIIFKTFQTHFAGKEKELAIFKNRKGNFYKLGELVKNDTAFAPSGILHDFQIDPTEPYLNEYDGYFMKEELCWNLVRIDWHLRVKNKIVLSNYQSVVKDFKRLYSENIRAYGNTIFHGNNSYAIGFDENIDWILTTENTLTTPSAAFLHKNLENLNLAEYDLICDFVTQYTGWKKVSKSVFDTIKDVKFCNWTDKNLENIHDNLQHEKYPISKELIEVFLKIDTNLLSHFIITEQNEQLYLEKKDDRTQFYSIDNELVTILERNNYIKLPSIIFPLNLNNLKTESDEFANELINNHNIGAHKALIRMVSNGNITTKQNYLEKLQKLDINIDCQYRYQDYEYKVVEMMSNPQLISHVSHYKQKVYIGGQQLSAIQYTDTVTVPEYRHKAFSLKDLESYNGIDLNVVKSNFINLHTTIFDTDEKPINQIYVHQVTNGEQVAFLHTQKRSQAKTQYPNLTETEILDSFYNHKLENIEIVFLNFLNWIFVENENLHLLLEDEKIPDWLRQWADNEDKRKWLKDNKLRFDNCSSVKLRRNYNQNILWTKNLIDEEVKNAAFANNTFEWLSQKEDFNNDCVKNCIDFEQVFVLKNSNLPNYLLVKQTIADKQWLLVKKEILLRSNCVYFKELEDSTFLTFREKLKEKGILYLLGIDSRPDTKFEDKIKEHFYQLEKEESIDEEKLLGCQEWTVNFYKKWKKENSSHIIKISNVDIPTLLKLKYGNPLTEIEDRSNAECKAIEKEHQKDIYVKANADKPKSILEVIEKHLDNVFRGEKDKFIRLQSLFIEELTETENQGIGDGNINIPAATDEDKAFLEEYAKRILENKDAIIAGHFGIGNVNDVQNHNPEKEEEEKDTTIDPLAGLIGERLVYLYLLQISNSEQNVKYVAASQPAYDIEYTDNGIRFLLEIKSSKKIDAASIPFYLKRSQYDYLYNHPEEENYFIIRVSLPTFGLMDLYDKMLNETWSKLIAQVKETRKEVEIPDDTRKQAIIIIDEYINNRIDELTNKFSQKINRMAFRVNVPARAREDFDDYR